MTLLDRLSSARATAGTFLSNFSVPCLWIAVAAGLLVGTPAFVGAWKLRGKIDDGQVARAQKEVADWKAATATERAEKAAIAQQLSDAVLENRDAQKTRLDAVAAGLSDLGQRVRLCATKSDVRVTVTPSGAIEAVPGGQLRDVAEAIREFAEACAVARDRDAINHNALIDWLEGMQKR